MAQTRAAQRGRQGSHARTDRRLDDAGEAQLKLVDSKRAGQTGVFILTYVPAR